MTILTEEQTKAIHRAFHKLTDLETERFLEDLPHILENYSDPLNEKLDNWEFSIRTSNHLRRAGILTYGGLLGKSRRDLQRSDFPRRCVSEIEAELERRGSTLKAGPE